MKINEINTAKTSITITSVPGERKAEGTAEKSSFGDVMRKNEEADVESRMRKLMGDIERQGDALGRTMDIKVLKQYKKLIAEFLDEMVTNSLKFSKFSQFDRRGRHKVFAVVKKVNSKLEELSREFMKDEKENIAILDKIGTIRGILLDVYM